MLADALGRPLRFCLTGGQVHDSKRATDLLDGIEAAGVIADKAYDSNDIRAAIADAEMVAVIPSNRSRKILIPHDKVAYRTRNRIERCFNKLKHFRRIATRYDRLRRSLPSHSYISQALCCGCDECRFSLVVRSEGLAPKRSVSKPTNQSILWGDLPKRRGTIRLARTTRTGSRSRLGPNPEVSPYRHHKVL